MAKEVISTGSAANDGTGDTLRSAGTKINLDYLDCRRPGTGVLPNKISWVKGKILKKKVKIDQFVKFSDFSLKKWFFYLQVDLEKILHLKRQGIT